MTSATDSGRWSVGVTVLPKTGVNDPEGEAILGGLRQLGHASVDKVRAGRLFQLEIEAETGEAAIVEATRMAEQLLCNQVIEQFSVELTGSRA